MEFHDVLHGLIKVSDENLQPLLLDLLNSAEIHRLRNMRQMNFDVPLIQELGRSRRLPHSIGVTQIAIKLAYKSKLDVEKTKVLVAAAMLHDAAIPPYGHLVESELKISAPNFKHEDILRKLIDGDFTSRGLYQELVPGEYPKLRFILEKHNINIEKLLELVSPKNGIESPISADIDIDNIDNVHRMAVMLGWHSAIQNFSEILTAASIDRHGRLCFEESARTNLEKWLGYRERIYTMIIAHKECIPYNALQTDIVRMAIKEEIITPDNWFIPEPLFEEKLRSANSSGHLRKLADQLISGCQYQTIDYVWFKNFNSDKKFTNYKIIEEIESELAIDKDNYGYFVWFEKGLIAREIKWRSSDNKLHTIGKNSKSCIIALVKKTSGSTKKTKSEIFTWRRDIISTFQKILNEQVSCIDYPEDYTGNFLSNKTNEFKF